MLHTLNRTQFLPLSLEAAWEFFSDPGNLCRITPDWLCFRITSQNPESMYAGQILTYTIQPLPGLQTAWVTEITHVEKPRFFVDEQRLGPYALWHHQHRFQEEGGGVRMEDLVSYALPLGLFGEAIHRLVVKRRLEAIFDYRYQVLEKMFPAPGEK
jgi:ligand-binding SRPBCC domain-containing protein